MTSIAAKVVRVFGVYAALTLLSAVATYSQNKNSEASAILTGTVCDSENHPVGNATISLESVDHAHKFTVQSDSDGRYRFEAVPFGSYELRAIKSDYGAA